MEKRNFILKTKIFLKTVTFFHKKRFFFTQVYETILNF
jgi:hypothetical protein